MLVRLNHNKDPMSDYHQELDRIFTDAKTLLLQHEQFISKNSHWGVCGMGSTGHKLVHELVKAGKTVSYFVDAKATPGLVMEGIPCFTKETIPSNLKATPIVVAIHNPQHDSVAAKEKLQSLGFSDVLLMQDVVDTFPDLTHFWLAPRIVTLLKSEDAHACLDAFQDDLSRHYFCSTLAFRLLGEKLPKNEADQYAPVSIPALPEPLKWIDCGAFTGDTLDFFKAKNIYSDWCMAFEPDPENYKTLALKYRGKATLIPCGVSDSMQTITFTPDGASGTFIGKSQPHSVTIQLTSIDDMLGSQDINFFKMNIEGAELLALNGAKQTIRSYQPRLAIATYHHPFHMWDIIYTLKQIGFKGSYMLRPHAHNTFDTVLYGITL